MTKTQCDECHIRYWVGEKRFEVGFGERETKQDHTADNFQCPSMVATRNINNLTENCCEKKKEKPGA